MSHLRTVTASARQRLVAWQRSQRLAASIDLLLRQALAAAKRSIPDDPHFSQATMVQSRIRFVLAPLGPLAARQLRSGLGEMARFGWKSSGSIVRGTLTNRVPTRRVRREADGDPSRDYLADLGELIDSLSEDLISRIVGPAPDRLTKLVDPNEAAGTVWQAIAAGKDRREVVSDLEDLFGGYSASARRIARTEGLRVATQSQLAVSEQLGDLIVGYQVFSVGDSRVRPAHRERHGTIYYRNPKPGQLGFDSMPHPPIDAGGILAHNCRCTLVPVFADIEDDDLLTISGFDFDEESGELTPRILV